MKKDGCYLSITGEDVMVNRVVTSGELRRDAYELEELDDPCSSFQATAKRSSVSSTSSSSQQKKDKINSSSTHSSKQSISSSRQRIDVEVEEEARQSLTSGYRNHQEPSIINNSKKKRSAVNRKEIRTSPASLEGRKMQPLMNLIRDFGTCFLLIVSGLLVIFGKDFVTDKSDAILALFAVILLYVTIYPKMKESGYILLQTLPKHIDVNRLKKSFLLEFSGSVLSIHDLHIWCLTSEQIIATCHVTLKSSALKSYTKLSRSMEKFFAREGISLATIQPEFMSDADSNGTASSRSSYTCLYKCSNSKDSCLEFKCCHENESECLDAQGLLMHLEHPSNNNNNEDEGVHLTPLLGNRSTHKHHSHSRA